MKDLEIEQLKQENARLHHLTNVLIQHIWKSGSHGLPLKEIDKQLGQIIFWTLINIWVWW